MQFNALRVDVANKNVFVMLQWRIGNSENDDVARGINGGTAAIGSVMSFVNLSYSSEIIWQ